MCIYNNDKFIQPCGNYYVVDRINYPFVNFSFYGKSGKKQFSNTIHIEMFENKIKFSNCKKC